MSYEHRYFVRMTIIFNATKEKIGTLEIFNRGVTPHYGVHGILRLDLMSKYEDEEVILAVMELVHKYFYEQFEVDWIVTKATHRALIRREVLEKLGYIAMDKFELVDYYGRRNH